MTIHVSPSPLTGEGVGEGELFLAPSPSSPEGVKKSHCIRLPGENRGPGYL